jgi:glycosyltransferase involved in cell wall biosynthesis
MVPGALYLCYQSVAEPLTQTQVVAYLEGLAFAGYRIVLLTFEPRRLSADETEHHKRTLLSKGIVWHCLRYHKSPTVPATSWDVLAGIVVGLRLVHKYRARVLHARGHVPGVMALVLKNLTDAKFLLDVRGFMAEEYVDAGVWPAGGILFRMVKRVERRLVAAADALIVLTSMAKRLLERWYPREVGGKHLEVIPCCVDFRQTPALPQSANGEGTKPGGPTLVYAGKLEGWYLTEAMVDFVATARDSLPGLRWHVWTQSDSGPLRRLLRSRHLEQQTTVGRATPEALPKELSKACAALSFIKPCLSKVASSPTKVAEYLAAGLPVVSTAGIGDLDALLTTSPESGSAGTIGVVVRACTQASYQEAMPRLLALLRDSHTAGRCRAAAAEHFDLERVGWRRYRDVYRRLMDGGARGDDS